MFKGTEKDIITNIFSLCLSLSSAVQVYIGTLGGGSINYTMLVLTIITALCAWYIGKDGQGKAKQN